MKWPSYSLGNIVSAQQTHNPLRVWLLPLIPVISVVVVISVIQVSPVIPVISLILTQ